MILKLFLCLNVLCVIFLKFKTLQNSKIEKVSGKWNYFSIYKVKPPKFFWSVRSTFLSQIKMKHTKENESQFPQILKAFEGSINEKLLQVLLLEMAISWAECCCMQQIIILPSVQYLWCSWKIHVYNPPPLTAVSYHQGKTWVWYLFANTINTQMYQNHG